MSQNDWEALTGTRPSLEHPELYRRLLDTLGEGVCLSDEEGLIVYTNPAEDAMFGYGPGELIGRHLSLLNGYEPEEYARALEAVTVELRQAGGWKGEWTNRRQNGERFYTNTKITAVEIEGRAHWLSVQEDVTDERLRADELKDRELRLEIAAEAADLGVWDWDLATNAFVYSKRARDICGFSEEAPITLDDVVAATHPDDYPFTSAQARRAMDPSLRADEPYRYRIIRPDGTIRWVVAHGRAVFSAREGAIVAARYIGTIQDITEAHALESKLRESEARFRAMADSTPAPAWVTDRDGQVVFANRAFAEVAGVAADQLSGDVWVQLLHPDDRADVAERRRAAWEAGHIAYSFEARFKNPAGGWFWMRVAAHPRFDDDRVFQGYVGIAVDMTEAKQAEEELRASAARLRLAVVRSQAGDWSWNAASGALHLSEAAINITGLPALISWNELRSLMNETNRGALAAAAQAGREDGWEVELLIKRPNDGAPRWIAVRGQATFAGGELTGMIGLIFDIGERKQREEVERVLVREVDHRAKNVLAIVLALARLTPFRSQEQYMEDFVGRVAALGRVHGLLSHNRWQNVDFEQVVRDELAAAGADMRGSLVQLSGPKISVGPLAAQPFTLIMHELAVNAVRHGGLSSTQGGGLRIDWREVDGQVLVQWLEQCSALPANRQSGGFGATMIDNAVRQIDGVLTRDWTPTGLNCVLRFHATRGASVLHVRTAFDSASDRAKVRSRVLVVDDEPLIALDMKDLLERAGFAVVGPAHTLEDAMILAAEGAFDVALLDVNLHGRAINPVVGVLQRASIPFALVTGYGDTGLDAVVIQKPIAPERVLSVLASLLTKAETAAEN